MSHAPGRAALGAQAAMQADILVLRHDAAGLERRRHIDVLREVHRRRHEPGPQLRFVAVLRERDAVHRADVDARVAFDAKLVVEDRLHVAIEAPLCFRVGGLQVEAELDFDANVRERDHLVLERHLVPLVRRDRVVVAPLVNAHLLRGKIDMRRRALRHVLAGTILVDRDRGVVAMRHGPDDVLRTESGVAAEKHARTRRRHGHLVDDRHAPGVELEADVALDPRERVFLADRHQDVVAREVNLRLARRHELPPALLVALRRDLLERHARQFSAFMRDGFRDKEVVNGNAFVRRVFLFPRRGLHLVEPRANDHLHLFAAEALGAAAAVHRGVAAAQHDDPLADLRRVAEGHAREPVDADVDVRRGFLAARNVEVAPARRAAADEYRIPALREKRAEAIDPLVRAELDAEIEDVAYLLVDYNFRQPELGNLRAHHSAGAIVAVEHDAVVAERREIARDRQRCGSGADERDALAVFLRRGPRQPGANVFLVVGGDALQPADRDRLRLDLFGIPALFNATATARRLAGTVAGAPENAGKDVGFPIDEISIAKAARRNQSDVFGNSGMGRARPLTVDDFVEIVGIRDIRRLQTFASNCSLSGISAAMLRLDLSGGKEFAPPVGFPGKNRGFPARHPMAHMAVKCVRPDSLSHRLAASPGPALHFPNSRIPMNAPDRAPLRLTEFSHGGGCGCKIAPAVLRQILGNSGIEPDPERTARRRRDLGRRGGLSAERTAGRRSDDGLLHADRRRPVRLRHDRSDQRHLRRVRDGRYAALRAGARRDAHRQLAGRDDPPHPRRRRSRVRARRNSHRGRPHDRFRRTDLRTRRHRARRSEASQAQRGRATRRRSRARQAARHRRLQRGIETRTA